MRRYYRALIVIGILILFAALALGFQTIKIGGFKRGGDTPLGLKLGLDLQGGIHLVYQAQIEDPVTGEKVAPTSDQMDSLKASIERRVNKSGLGEPIILILGDDRLLVQIPGVEDITRAKSLIGETARLEFKHRTFDIPLDIEGVTQEGVVSVRIEDRPVPISEGAEDTTQGETSTEPGTEGQEAAQGTDVAEAGTEPEVAADAEEELQSQEEGAAAESTGESEASAEGDAEQAVAEGADAAESGAGEAAQAGDEAQEAGDGEASEEEVVPEPVFVIELTPEAATAFASAVDQLDASLAPVPGSNDIFASFLVVSVDGLESRTYQMTTDRTIEVPGGPLIPIAGARNIERIDDTDSFRIAIPPDVAESTENAIAIFGQNPQITLTQISGKVDEDIGLTGDDLSRAYAGQHTGSGRPIVNIEFTDRGTRIFGDLTTEIAGSDEQIAIILDEEELIAPVVEQAITSGVAFIQGNDFTIERVRDLALLLESGRLPIPIGDPILERDVGPSLGQASLDKSVIAGSIGLALVLGFMALYYRAPGIVAAVALVIYTSLLLAFFKILPVTLTLSGIAAAILSVGMAVDANILIFERMKEELRQGRTLLSAINIGFNRAWPAIRDSNVSTLITCAILFWFADQLGAAVVQGFAITLAIGVGLSMFSAIFVSRTFLRLVAETGIGRRIDLFVPAGAEDLPQRRTEPVAQRS